MDNVFTCMKCRRNTDFSLDTCRVGYGQIEALCSLCIETYELKVVLKTGELWIRFDPLTEDGPKVATNVTGTTG